jgi:hypothetical protein
MAGLKRRMCLPFWASSVMATTFRVLVLGGGNSNLISTSPQVVDDASPTLELHVPAPKRQNLTPPI